MTASGDGRLVVVTHAPHKVVDGRVVSLAPEVVELDRVGAFFREVDVLAPTAEPSEPLPYPEAAYEHASLRLVPAPFAHDALLGQILLRLPRLAYTLARAVRRASAVHLRCPSEHAFVCMALLALRRPPTFVKYRGAWDGRPGEPRSYRLQRWLLRRCFAGSFVGVYPSPLPAPPQFTEMFSTSLAVADIERARVGAQSRRAGPRLLTACALRGGKNVDVILRALALLPARFTLAIAGNGEQRRPLEQLARSLDLEERVRFLGTLDQPALHRAMGEADLFVLASRTEGYPKACIEAMAHGLPCVASAVNNLPDLLKGRGLVFELGNPRDLHDQLMLIAGDDGLYVALSRAARRFSEDKTLERLADLYEAGLKSHGILAGAA